MTTTELVKALRICFRDLDDGADCPNCPLYGNENCLAEVMGGAADLIEWLIGANANLHEELEQKDKIQAIFRQKLVTFEAERDALLEKKRWIPVTERLPEDRGDVLVVAYWHERWGVHLGWCARERGAWSVRVGFANRSDLAVTHWMPLPEAP